MKGIAGLSRGHWAAGVGWIIYSLNEIDYLFADVYGIVTQQPKPINLPAQWLTGTTADRLKVIEDALTGVQESPATLRIKRLLIRTRALMEKRNHIAHGVLALAEGDQFQMLRYHKKSKQFISISYAQLSETEREARKLSDDFSLLLGLCDLHKQLLKPYVAGEPQGMEKIRPYDPAPD